MKLTYEGKARVYHPASGLDLIPGTHDYGEEKADDLAAAGLKDPKDVQKAKDRAAAKRIKAAAALEGSNDGEK